MYLLTNFNIILYQMYYKPIVQIFQSQSWFLLPYYVLVRNIFYVLKSPVNDSFVFIFTYSSQKQAPGPPFTQKELLVASMITRDDYKLSQDEMEAKIARLLENVTIIWNHYFGNN